MVKFIAPTVLALVVSVANSFAPATRPYRSLASLEVSLSDETSFVLAAEEDKSLQSNSKFWKWQGHDVFAEVRAPQSKTDKPVVILLHGFGASTTYWRETMSTLQKEGYEVHALDLLGQGRSSKPVPVGDNAGASTASISSGPMEMGVNTGVKVEYSINLWAEMVDDYARHHQLGDNGRGVVLMGNSLGSLVALSAATGDFAGSADRNEAYLGWKNTEESSLVKGICLFNCAIGLNSRNVLKNPAIRSSPLQLAAFSWLFDVLNSLIFDNEVLLNYALNNVVTKELLSDALKGLYTHDPERVDDELVDSFYYPAKLGGSGAVEAIRQIYTNDAGLTPIELHEKYPEFLDNVPLHLIWGEDDVVTPIKGDVGQFYCDRIANNRGGKGMTTIDIVKGGHVPFDDNPVESHDAMMTWLARKVVKN